MRLVVFIDYDNLLQTDKSAGLLAVVTKALLQIPSIVPIERGTCEVRVYGGWYEGSNLTPLAERISA